MKSSFFGELHCTKNPHNSNKVDPDEIVMCWHAVQSSLQLPCLWNALTSASWRRQTWCQVRSNSTWQSIALFNLHYKNETLQLRVCVRACVCLQKRDALFRFGVRQRQSSLDIHLLQTAPVTPWSPRQLALQNFKTSDLSPGSFIMTVAMAIQLNHWAVYAAKVRANT